METTQRPSAQVCRSNFLVATKLPVDLSLLPEARNAVPVRMRGYSCVKTHGCIECGKRMRFRREDGLFVCYVCDNCGRLELNRK